MEIKRLFDALDYQLLRCGNKVNTFAAKENGVWKEYSLAETQATINQLSAGLLQLGVGGNNYTAEGADKIAIISNNRPEWVFTDLAVQQTGGVLVPLYPTTNALEIEFILNDAQVQYIFVSDEEMFKKISDVAPKVPSLKKIYSFNNISGCSNWKQLLNNSSDWLAKVTDVKKAIPASHTATIIYTSGTTGTPKGVVLSHSNIYTCIKYSIDSFPFEERPDAKALSFLPLNHIFEKVITYIYLFSCIGIYYAESLETIGDNIREVKPFGFSCVPRLLEKVYEKIVAKGNELTGIKRSLFFWALGLAKQYDDVTEFGWWYKFQLKLANKIIFKKWREALGGNIEFIVTGGAACPVHLLKIFNAAQIPIYEGYGPTENSPVISVGRKGKGNSRFGTVGPPIDGIEVKLADDGEILVRGTTVMDGYYKRPDITAETIIDGWLHTGDIGAWIDNKFLKITDRKKELFKTSGGKYVAPQPIENKCRQSEFIEQIVLIGDNKKFVSALIVPSFDKLKGWCKQHNNNYTSNEEIIKNVEVVKLFDGIINKFNLSFNQVEQIKKFVLLPKEWSIETGEMTPKMSLKRKVITEKFAKEIESIYT